MDEIGSKERRRNVCEWVKDMCNGLKNACFVLTSRATGYRKLDGIELEVPHLRADIMDFSPEQIRMIRDPEIQQKELKVPAEHLSGHGWHTYTLVSQDKTVKFSFTHNVNGREVYARGTLDAIRFLARKIQDQCAGKVFSMIDVLAGT